MNKIGKSRNGSLSITFRDMYKHNSKIAEDEVCLSSTRTCHRDWALGLEVVTLKSLWVLLGFKTRAFISLIKEREKKREEEVHF